MTDEPVKKPKGKKRKWLIALAAAVAAISMASEVGLLPPLVGELANQALDEIAPPPE